jgi:N-acetylglutamate synthase-like GNAT family acetyltransferase
MNIRIATYHDAPTIKSLLAGLGYETRTSILVNQLEALFNREDQQVFVYEARKEVLGFVTVHFMPLLGFEGGVLFISCLAVDNEMKDQSIEKALEQFVSDIARRRKCDRIQVHCRDLRPSVHKFYVEQGYYEYPIYFNKQLVYGE